MVYDEIIRLAEETQRIARDQKAQHYTHQTIDRMRLERIKELIGECTDHHEKIKEHNEKLKAIHERINCVYAGEEDHLLIEHILHGRRTITNINVMNTKTNTLIVNEPNKNLPKGFRFTQNGKSIVGKKSVR